MKRLFEPNMTTPWQAPIIKKRRIRGMALLNGLLALCMLVYGVYTYLLTEKIPLIEEIARLFDTEDYVEVYYVGITVVVLWLLIPFLRTLLKPKRVEGGVLILDTDSLTVVDRRKKYTLPIEEMSLLEWKVQSDAILQNATSLSENHLHIPTSKGVFRCAFHLRDVAHKQGLIQILRLWEEAHEVKILLVET